MHSTHTADPTSASPALPMPPVAYEPGERSLMDRLENVLLAMAENRREGDLPKRVFILRLVYLGCALLTVLTIVGCFLPG